MQQAENGRSSYRQRIILITVALMTVFILVQSLLPKNVSAKESGWLIEKVINPILRVIGCGPVSHGFIRKAAHVAEFAVLAFLLSLYFERRILLGAGIAFLIAFLDESVQLLSGRGASITDVWIDLIGIAAGAAFGALVWVFKKRARVRQEADNGRNG